MRTLLALLLPSLLLCGSAWADVRCYDVTAARHGAHPGSELCVEESHGDAKLSFRSGGGEAVFHLRLLNRVRCIDCNKDTFGTTSPDGLGLLSVRFDGRREGGLEQGVVQVGSQSLHYRSRPAAPPPSAPPAQPAAPQSPAVQPMSPESFTALLKALDGQAWSASGLKGIVSAAAKDNHFTCEQVVAVLKKVPGASLKENAARQLVPRIVDYGNLFLVSGELGHDAGRYRPGEAPRRSP